MRLVTSTWPTWRGPNASCRASGERTRIRACDQMRRRRAMEFDRRQFMVASAAALGTPFVAEVDEAAAQIDTRAPIAPPALPPDAGLFPGFDARWVRTRGADIFLRHGGSGPPLLLLHGNPLTHTSWHKIAGRLAQRFHVVAADLRGYGDSVGPEDGGENHINYSFGAMAQDQVEVMEQLGYREFFVAGHDRGARTTARMCLDYPERVKRAALIDILPNH